jgi:hypothetical protein
VQGSDRLAVTGRLKRSAVLVAFVVVACDSNVVAEPSVAGIRVQMPSGAKAVFMSPGESVKVDAFAVAADGSRLSTQPTISFLSRQPGIVRVDAKGTVTLLATGGTHIVGSLEINGRTFLDSVYVASATAAITLP